MSSAWISIAAYSFAMICFAIWARRDASKDDEGYYLAGRKLNGIVLLITMAATNFSAFTVYGASGAAYRIGLSFLPIMAFGTGFMAVSMYFIGKKARELSVKHNAMTAPEIIRGQTGSINAQKTMALVLVIATIPYLALQPRAAGIVVSALFGGPEWIGSLLVTILVIGYTITGGLRAVVRTDIAQGIVALVLLWIGLILVVNEFGGLNNSMEQLASIKPELLGREGNYTILIWSCTLLLWIFADPMFPQLYQRLCAADSNRDIGIMATMYPIVAWIAFLPPILIGALGHIEFSDLDRAGSDNILPLQVIYSGGEWLGGLVLIAGLAALMSTMDSQLLATGSLVTRDLLQINENKGIGYREIVIICLAILGLLLSLWSNLSILDLGLLAFTMYAVIFPSVALVSFMDEVKGSSIIISILAGEAIVLLAVFTPEIFDGWWIIPTGPAMPVAIIPAIIASVIALLITQYYSDRGSFDEIFSFKPKIKNISVSITLVLVFINAHDYWWWGDNSLWIFGMPKWIWWSLFLSVIQVIIFTRIVETDRVINEN